MELGGVDNTTHVKVRTYDDILIEIAEIRLEIVQKVENHCNFGRHTPDSGHKFDYGNIYYDH